MERTISGIRERLAGHSWFGTLPSGADLTTSKSDATTPSGKVTRRSRTRVRDLLQ